MIVLDLLPFKIDFEWLERDRCLDLAKEEGEGEVVDGED